MFLRYGGQLLGMLFTLYMQHFVVKLCFTMQCGISSFSPSHLSASTLRSVPARIMTCQCLRSSAISVVIWFLAISTFTRSRHLSIGLPRFLFPSTVICNIFLVASSLSLLCTCPNHLNLFSLRNSAIGYICASFQMSTFLTWSSLVFPLAHRGMRISVVCNFLSSFFRCGISFEFINFCKTCQVICAKYVSFFIAGVNYTIGT